MAVYKFFPIKDASLYSYYPDRNSGIDEMLEVYNQNNATATPQVSRYLVQFDQEDINNFISSNNITSSINFYLRNYIAFAQGFNLDGKLEIYPISGSWENGTGKFDDSPEVTNGVSWKSRNFKDGNTWNFLSNPFTTQSYNTSYTDEGGGVWFTGSSDGKELEVSQSFSLRTSKDLDVNVTDIGLVWYSSSNSIGNDTNIQNNGFLIKLEDNIEFSTSSSIQPISKFFSVDTNTIYPPELQLRYDDYINNSTSSISVITDTTDLFFTELREAKNEFEKDTVQKFRVNVKAKYPIRTYKTQSEFVVNHYLPENSFYSIVDLDTNEFIIDFDPVYTKISRDEVSNFFNIYMNGLEPERYYKILIKSEYNGQVNIIDDKLYFKVINS